MIQDLLKALPPDFWQALIALAFTAVSAALTVLFEALRRKARSETELALIARVEAAARTAVAAVEQTERGSRKPLDYASQAQLLGLARTKAHAELGDAGMRALERLSAKNSTASEVLETKIEAALLESKRASVPPPRGFASLGVVLTLACVAALLCTLGCTRERPLPVPPASEPSYQDCKAAVKRASHAEANRLCPPAEVQWLECEHRAAIMQRQKENQEACRR